MSLSYATMRLPSRQSVHEISAVMQTRLISNVCKEHPISMNGTTLAILNFGTAPPIWSELIWPAHNKPPYRSSAHHQFDAGVSPLKPPYDFFDSSRRATQQPRVASKRIGPPPESPANHFFYTESSFIGSMFRKWNQVMR